MRSLRARLGSVAVVATIATLALAGCSSGGDAAGGATAEPLPDVQQKLVYIPSYGWAGSDISQSPLEIGISMAISQTLEALITLDKDSKPQPKLADSWAWTDPTTLVFKLHPGESLGFDSSIPHVLRNLGSETFEGIWFVHGQRH